MAEWEALCDACSDSVELLVTMGLPAEQREAAYQVLWDVAAWQRGQMQNEATKHVEGIALEVEADHQERRISIRLDFTFRGTPLPPGDYSVKWVERENGPPGVRVVRVR